MLTALSRHLEGSDPELASALYPLNVEATLAGAVNALGRPDSDTPAAEVESRLRAAVPYNAGDARLYSLLGESLSKEGDDKAAAGMFDHALLLARTEIHALRWSIQRAVTAGDHRQALDRMDMLFRRWPEQIGLIAPAIPAVFADQNGYDAFAERLRASPPWRPALLRALAGETSTNKVFAAQLLQDLATGPTPPSSAETASLLAGLFRDKQYDLAYRTFLLTLTEPEKELSGAIFDGTFQRAPSGRLFDWSARQQPGVVVSLPATSGGLSVEFANTPVMRIGLQQYLKLPAGAYRLEFKASAFSAVMPKSLLWNLACVGPAGAVAQVEIPDGDYRDRVVTGDFTVPADCPLQLLTLQTRAMVESWSNRYNGRVLVNYIRISEARP